MPYDGATRREIAAIAADGLRPGPRFGRAARARWRAWTGGYCERRAAASLSERELRDLGLTRGDLFRILRAR